MLSKFIILFLNFIIDLLKSVSFECQNNDLIIVLLFNLILVFISPKIDVLIGISIVLNLSIK